jgi:hypothetical protein
MGGEYVELINLGQVMVQWRASQKMAVFEIPQTAGNFSTL